MATKSSPNVTRALSVDAQTRQAKVYENMKKTQDLHAEKTQKTNANFKNARITSCSGVLMKNGHAVCLAFSATNPKPIDISAMKSSETTSVAQ